MGATFPLQLTEAEAAFGFDVREAPSGLRAIVVDLSDALRAVKVHAPDGSTEYAICDERLRPLYHPAKTLEELRKRFPSP